MRPLAQFRWVTTHRPATELMLVLLASAAAATGCSFEWDDYRAQGSGGASTSTSSATATGASSSGGSGGDCGSGEKVCGGQCVAVTDPDYGCTPTGCEPCSLPNASSTCVSGECAFADCLPGYGDCDGMPGCETSTTTSPLHCGGCNMPCPGTSCVNSACGNESCINNVDDDDDGLVDCEDSDCVTFACAVVQAPWKGPVFLYDNAYATKPTDCSALPGSLVYEGYSGLMFSPPSCSGCSCGSPTVSCALAPLAGYADTGCATPLINTPQPAPPTCGGVGGTGIFGVRAAAPTASGSCAPAGGAIILDPYTWDTAGVACQPTQQGGGCPGQGVCVGNAPASFGPKPCIYRNGDQPCPAPYDVKHVFSDDASDSRACSSCQCALASGSGSCSATTHVYTQANCLGTAIDVPNSNSCTAVGGGAASMKAEVSTTNNFISCNASGGMPVGTVEESGTTTVCCMP